MRKVFLSLFLGMFLLSFASAWNFGIPNQAIFKNITNYDVYTYINVTDEPLWTANFSSYYTKTDVNNINTSMKNYVLYVNSTNGVGVGSYNDNWINGTIDSKISINNASVTNALNTKLGISQWNATNTSYYLASNPAGYFSTISNIGNWTLDKPDYALLSVLNNGSYLNPPTTDTFVANYSTFLTHITFGTLANGTLWSWIMNGTLAKSSELNNGSYLNQDWLLKSQWNATNTSYMTGENFTLQNNSIKNYILYVNSTNGAGSGSYDDSWINGTIDNKIGIANTTLYEILMNGSYLNAEATDTFVGNYSTFLTHITYADVMNGTLKDYFDGLYIGIGDETETKWNANYSAFLTHITSATLNNGSYLNQDWLLKSQWNATNTSYALLTQLNNGSYLNYAWNSTNTSYMTGDNFTLQNTSMKNYIAVVNTSMDNLVDLNNASTTNSIATKLSLSGGTMTGNISLSTSGVRLTNGTANTAVIYHNGTGWIIRG